MKRMLMIIAMSVTTLALGAQECYTKEFGDVRLNKKAAVWVGKGKWRNGFDKAKPHESVNQTDFYTQYRLNSKQWKALFRWLANTDLLAIPRGKHPIEGTSIVVSVEDSENKPLEKRQSESHYHHIDFQYVVKGVERFGVIEHNSSKPNCEYKPDVIHYDYDRAKAKFYDSRNDEFFLFFPSDWHIAKIANDTDDQNIRVIVAKLDYIEE